MYLLYFITVIPDDLSLAKKLWTVKSDTSNDFLAGMKFRKLNGCFMLFISIVFIVDALCPTMFEGTILGQLFDAYGIISIFWLEIL